MTNFNFKKFDVIVRSFREYTIPKFGKQIEQRRAFLKETHNHHLKEEEENSVASVKASGL